MPESRTIVSNVTFPGVQEWVDEHGLDPRDYRSTIIIEDDGRVTLIRLKRDHQGRAYIDPDTGDVAGEPVTITPKRPFPGS